MSAARSLKDDPTHLFLKNMDWLQPKNLEKPIRLMIDNECLELRRNIDKIVSYYETKPPDVALLPERTSPKEEPQCARDLQQNIYQLRKSDPKVTLPENLSWSENSFEDANWQFWFHQWTFAQCLMDGYRATQNSWYMQRLKWVVEDWWQKNFRPDPPSDFSWYDHTVPLRLDKLTVIWEFVRRHGFLDASFVEIVIRFVYWHGRILDEEEAFKNHQHNHGLDQAYYLFCAALVFPEIESAGTWRENALPRVKRELEFTITDEGVQKENSPVYHQHIGAYVFEIMENIERHTSQVLSPRLRRLENEMLKFNVVVAQPDGILPEIGDTSPGTRLHSQLPNLKTLAWYPHYDYVVSGGLRGTPPTRTRFIFPESGYYIYRDKWDHPGENEACHLVLKCSFLASGHRHDDDNHILLYCFGEHWLTDGGIFGHAVDPRRDYAVSAKAHNVTIPEGAEPNHDIERRFGCHSKWGITAYDQNDLSSLTCQSHMYEGYLYQRNLTVVADRNFEIMDRLRRIEGDYQGLVYTQFRIPRDKIIRIDLGAGKVRALGKTGHVMEIAFDPSINTKVDILRGDNTADLSSDTTGWRQVKPVNTVRFIGKMEQNNYTATFQITLLEHV